MASLILHDTFQPYYAGRDGEADRSATNTAAARKRDAGSSEPIRLPADKQAAVAEAGRDRRPVAH